MAAACSSPADQIVSGQLAVESFPSPVHTVRVAQGSHTIVEKSVAADGTFSVALPAGKAYRLEFAAGTGQPALVFPRRAGSLDVTFDIKQGGAPFSLGMVRYIGNPADRAYTYGPGGGEDDGECEDGIDSTTGEVCVDDDDDEGAACEADDDDIECEDGTDPTTGLACEDGDDEANDGETDDGDGDGEEDDDGESPALPGEAAVAEHNLPALLGCGEDGEDDDDIECENGTDPTTGLPCEDGDDEGDEGAE